MAAAQPLRPARERAPFTRDALRLVVQADPLALGLIVLVLVWPHLEGFVLWRWLFWLAFPDIVSLGPLGVHALLRGRRAGDELRHDLDGLAAGRPGELPWWFPPVYNLVHTYVLPALLGAALGLTTGSVPWALSGWVLHVCADRTLGYTLRRRDGSLS